MAERGRRRGFDRAEALDRAMRLFWRKTYEGTTLAELTEAMGIAPPSLYAAFGSKDALFCEAVAHYADSQGIDMWRSLDEAPSARGAIESFLMGAAHAYSEPGNPPGCLIVLGSLHPVRESDLVHMELRKRRKANLDRLAERLERAVAEGELPVSFAAQDAAAFYLSVQTGMSVIARDGADRSTLEAVARGAMFGWDRWIEATVH